MEEFHLEKEEQCIAICQTYSPIADVGCTFAAWEASAVFGGTCTLYKEAFADYISHCQLLAGPPDISDCSVDNPEENSCHGIRCLDQALWILLLFWIINDENVSREGECVQKGQVTETTQSVRESN